jgi:transposase-like protein
MLYHEDNWSNYSCPNEACADYGAKVGGNIRLERRYGTNDVELLRCRTCKKTFSENRGTPFFRLRLPHDKLYEMLTSLARGGGIRGTADVVSVNRNTVERITKTSGQQAEKFNDFMLRNLKMDQVKCYEFWTYVKSKKGAARGKAKDTSQ